MNKKLVMLLLCLFAMALSGCACEHVWTEADCLNPQVCSKCEETGGEALGHDWAAATCTAPELCLRCEQTRGEPLGHSFGEWSLGETEMTHTCSSCGLSETAELDRGIQLETMVAGLWEFYGLYQEEAFYPAYNLPVPGDCLTFGSDRSVTGMVDQAAFCGTWEFLEYQEQEEDRLFYFQVTGENDRKLQMLYVDSPEDDSLRCFFGNDVQTILSRNDTSAGAVAGTWGAEAGGSMYALTFHDDRTVTGYLGEEFEGTWQLLPIREISSEYVGSYRYCGMYIRYDQNGEECVLSATVHSPVAYGDDPLPEEFTADTITLTYMDTKLTFEAMTPEELEMKAAAMREGPNMLVGTWSSMYHRAFRTNPATDTLSMDYSVTFNADGTFTASVGKEISGTWMYVDSRGTETYKCYTYCFYIQGDRYAYDMELEYSGSQVPQLWMESKSTVPGSRRMLFLNKRSPYQDHTVRSLMGTWTSMYAESENSRYNTMDYSFTFHEDGTFTGNDGTPCQGTWIYDRTRDEDVHHFSLFLSGQSQEYANITMYSNNDEIWIDCKVSTESGYRSIALVQLSEEDLAAAQLGPAFILGEWADSDGNSITIFEDGSFTANLDTAIHGSWSFRRYKPDAGYWYDFTFPGQYEYSDHTMYGHPDEDLLTFRIVTQDSEEFYQMYRKK